MKIDITTLKDKDGNLDPEKLANLVSEKPLLTNVPKEKIEEFSVKLERDRIETFPDSLPTYGMFPFPPDEHEHIGNYENKQNLYLLLAHSYNKLMEYCKDLEKRIDEK